MPQYAKSPRTNEQHSTFSLNASTLSGIGKKMMIWLMGSLLWLDLKEVTQVEEINAKSIFTLFTFFTSFLFTSLFIYLFVFWFFFYFIFTLFTFRNTLYFYYKFQVLELPAERVEGTEFSKELWRPYNDFIFKRGRVEL